MSASNTKSFSLKLGLFIIVALSLLVGVMYLLGSERNLFGKTITVQGIFTDVGGLIVGNNVRFSGINVGTVEAIQIVTDSTVKVVMVVDDKVAPFIKKDAQAIIGGEGLMGNKVINIMPGNPAMAHIEDNDTIQTLTPVSIDDITKNLKVTSENAADITSDIAVMTARIRNGDGALGKLLFDKKLAKSVDKTTANLAEGSGQLNELMEGAKDNFLFKGYFKKKDKEKQEAEEARNRKIREKKGLPPIDPPVEKKKKRFLIF